MPDQVDSWIELENRTTELKRAIAAVTEEVAGSLKTPEEIYHNLGWGSLSNPVLMTALLEMRRNSQLKDASEILKERPSIGRPETGKPSVFEDPEEESETWMRRRQSIVTKDISWFINNGETDEIKLKAREYRERVLLDLYLEHVKMTGETYFPELHRLLKAEWDFSSEG